MVSAFGALFPRTLRRFGRGKTEAPDGFHCGSSRLCMRANHQCRNASFLARMRWDRRDRLLPVGGLVFGPVGMFFTPRSVETGPGLLKRAQPTTVADRAGIMGIDVLRHLPTSKDEKQNHSYCEIVSIAPRVLP